MRVLVVSSLLVFAAHGESSWKNFVNEEVTEVKNMFDDLKDLDQYMTAISRRNRQQHPKLVPESRNNANSDYVLLSESMQGMRDGSFGPLKTGQDDIHMITQGVKFFSKGSTLLAQGKRYIKLLEILRTSYMTFPGDFLDSLSALIDYADSIEHSKDKLLGAMQDFISYADNVPWTVKMMCQESRMHHILHFTQQLAILCNDGLESSLTISHTFMQIQDSIREYEYKLDRHVEIRDSFDPQLMAEYRENITYNNDDIEEISDWYKKSSEYYDGKIDNQRRYMVALIHQMTVDNAAGDEVIANILYSVRAAAERITTIKYRLAQVTQKLSKSRRNEGHKAKDIFPNEPEWLQYTQKIGDVLLKLNESDHEQIDYIQEIDQIKMTKRNLIQSRRRCYVAKTREELGPYWTPRYGPKCTSHIEPDHATVPLKNCHPEHIQEHFRNEEDLLVDELSNVMHDLGISRFNFAREIPAEYESLETMLDTLGKKKRHSLARASDGSRLFPVEDEKAKVMEQLRFVFSVMDEFDEDILNGILEELPQYVNSEPQMANLTATYYKTAKSYKKTVKRANYLYKRGRVLLQKLYEDQVTIFQNQDIIAEELSDIQEQRITLGLIKDTFRVLRMASDAFTRNAEKNVRYWEQRVGQFQDVTREMCAGFYPRTLSHVGRIPCIVKSICDQRDLLTGAPLNCLLRDQWTEAKETFEAVLSIMLSQANKSRDKGRRRQRRDLSQHFTINTFSIDKRTHNYIKNVTEQCIIHHADLDLTNTICHNVFTCKEKECSLPFPTDDVVQQACSKLDYNYSQCKISQNLLKKIATDETVFVNYNVKKTFHP